jgi:transcriptional regulator with XRE-family HTH domain
MKTGKKIKKRRQKLGMSQYELADKVGYSRSAVANWENGHRELFPKTMRLIARALRSGTL